MSSCQWWCTGPLCEVYHDTQWGVPIHDDRAHFEALTLELMQAGLSWAMILKKREILCSCFAGFDFHKVAAFGEEDIQRILNTEGMIRSRRKIESIIGNAQCFLKIIDEFGSFDRFIWSFTEGYTYVYRDHAGRQVNSNDLSDNICKNLKSRGFRFLGSVTVYSYLQACGLINDHSPDCPRYRELITSGNIRFL